MRCYEAKKCLFIVSLSRQGFNQIHNNIHCSRILIRKTNLFAKSNIYFEIYKVEKQSFLSNKFDIKLYLQYIEDL